MSEVTCGDVGRLGREPCLLAPGRRSFPQADGGATVSRFVMVLSFALAVATLVPAAVGIALPDATRAAPALAGTVTDPASSDDAASAADAGDYTINFRCPEAVSPPAVASGLTCPMLIQDYEDIFGSPVMVVHPDDPKIIAFSAMHGGRGTHANPNDQPPSEASRHDPTHQPHTVFQDYSGGGADFDDNPYYAPDSMQRRDPQTGASTRAIFGEDNGIAVDREGRIYLASLYSYRDTEASTLPVATEAAAYEYAVGVWKGKSMNKPMTYDTNVRIIPSGAPGTVIDSLFVVHVPGPELVATVWRETPQGADAGSLVVHWTSAGDGGAIWTRATLDGLPPCTGISNPVALDGRILVACHATGGNATATVYAIDATTWAAEETGVLPFASGNLLLVHLEYGYVAAIASGVEAAAPFVLVSYGENGGAWSGAEDITSSLTQGTGAVLEARVTAAAFAPRSGNIHLIYKERYEEQANPSGAATIWKTFASLQATGSFLDAIPLQVGRPETRAWSPVLAGVGDGIFSDLHDSIVIWRNPGLGEDREFIAYGDYGYVRFAEVVEENFIAFGLPPPPATPPVPLATAGTVPATVGLPAGLLSGAMVARMMAARKKQAVEVGAE